MVAGALNLLGSDALFGRNWGSDPKLGREVPGLHFDVCYYAALEAAIDLGLGRVEAGAQGEHKIQRGYLPRLTYSSHYIRHPPFRRAVEVAMRQEAREMRFTVEAISQQVSPYKEGKGRPSEADYLTTVMKAAASALLEEEREGADETESRGEGGEERE